MHQIPGRKQIELCFGLIILRIHERNIYKDVGLYSKMTRNNEEPLSFQDQMADERGHQTEGRCQCI